MKILLKAKLPNDPFNAAVKDGTAGAKLNRILESLQPEAVYFTEWQGQRMAMLFLDVPDASKIPTISEPWFLTFHAEIELKVVMTPADLKKAGLEDLGKKWG